MGWQYIFRLKVPREKQFNTYINTIRKQTKNDGPLSTSEEIIRSTSQTRHLNETTATCTSYCKNLDKIVSFVILLMTAYLS